MTRNLMLYGGAMGNDPSVPGKFLQPYGHVLFIAYAVDHPEATRKRIQKLLKPWSVQLDLIDDAPNPRQAIANASAIFMCGGNTYRLLDQLQQRGLIEPIKQAVARGTPYFGTSAGANLAGLTIRTSNDWAIVEPRDFDALGLVPLQINPHFVDQKHYPTNIGEAREARMVEFLHENDVPVIGLPENAWISVIGDSATYHGKAKGLLALRGKPMKTISDGRDLSQLLQYIPHLDSPEAGGLDVG